MIPQKVQMPVPGEHRLKPAQELQIPDRGLDPMQLLRDPGSILKDPGALIPNPIEAIKNFELPSPSELLPPTEQGTPPDTTNALEYMPPD